jgi:hypothetical protein
VLIPVTIPVSPTVAVAVAPLLQTPPGIGSLRAVVAPTHTDAVPEIGEGKAAMVSKRTAAALPQELVRV